MKKKSSLHDYEKKRNFKVTSEPNEKSKNQRKNSKRKLIFVVQEHHARRLHYDFRLEFEGVLKSWAVPKGPSLDPKEKRLAIETEDHPLEYAKFHGTIPEGEYGAGEVFIWDKGTWESEDRDPHRALENGHLKFRLKGKKLSGSFVLVRTSLGREENNKNWLLMKHREDEKVEKKVKKKVKKIGLDPWPGFIPPQLPRLVESVPDEKGWIHEVKYDGYRMEAQLKDGIGRLFSRNAIEWSHKFPHLLNALEKIKVLSAIFDGEVVSLDEEGKSQFQELQNSLKSKKDQSLRYFIFDLLYLDGNDLRKKSLIERKKILKDLLKEAPPEIKFSDHIEGSGKEFLEVSCHHGLEGVVSKLMDSPYVSGRNEFWVKTKCSLRQEFVIGGWTKAQGGRSHFGSLLLGVFEKDLLRYVGRVGTGFSEKSLQEISRELFPLEVELSPFEINSPRRKEIHWIRPIKVCEVSFANWTKGGNLRAPVFHGLREDKPSKSIHLEKAKKMKNKQNSLRRISSPEKILFSKEGITKDDISNYYQKVAAFMLPHLRDRPLSLVRCPQGVEKKCFFQKHISGKVPPSLATFPVREEKGEEIYFSVSSKEGLQELVQLNAFEIHVWNCRKEKLLNPDQIVMDFDPGPGVLWKEVIDGAFELKKMLLDLGLESFVKLTGGKGLHLHIPIKPIYDWDLIRSFAHTLALELVSRNPKKYTANMSKRVRRGRIFIDYLRNDHGATAVAPYSLRARLTSSVALPVDWRELRKIKGSAEFTLQKALRKLGNRKKDPWANFLKLRQTIKVLSNNRQ